jgi:hypothetical protein
LLHLQQIYCNALPSVARVAAAPHRAMKQEIRTKQLKFLDSACRKQERAGQIQADRQRFPASAVFQ